MHETSRCAQEAGTPRHEGLAITRKIDEAVVLTRGEERIGRVSVSRLRGGEVRLVLDFPRDIVITREELI